MLMNPMQRPADTVRLSFTRALLLVGVLAALCFSVGEGLRLLPIPISSSTGAGSSVYRGAAFTPTASAPSRFTPGPITTPVPAQKRGERQRAHCEEVLHHAAVGRPVTFFRLPRARESVGYRSPRRASHRADRGPPPTV